MLRLDDYPQLAFVAWNRGVRTVSEADAFALYERNGRWIERASMTDAEGALFDRLLATLGAGVWLG